jgi:hypothetical protein
MNIARLRILFVTAIGLIIVFGAPCTSSFGASDSTQAVLNKVFGCASSSNIDLSVNLRGGLEKVLEEASTTGFAKIKNDSGFLALIQQFPAGDRLKAYELYLRCIKDNVGSQSDLGSRQNEFLMRFSDATTYKSIVQTFGEPEEERTTSRSYARGNAAEERDLTGRRQPRKDVLISRFQTASQGVDPRRK